MSVKGKKVVLYSGGLDSFCLAWKVKPDLLLYFDTGLPEQQREIERITSMQMDGLLPAPLTIDRRFHLAPYKLPNEVMPFRNLYFIAGGFSYGDQLYLGKTASSRNLDKNATFAKLAGDVLRYVSQRPEGNPPGLVMEDMHILLPFDGVTKSKFLAEYLSTVNGETAALMRTRSCYKADGPECGVCVSCVRKAIAFVNNGLPISGFKHDPFPKFNDQLSIALKDKNFTVVEEVATAMSKEALTRWRQ